MFKIYQVLREEAGEESGAGGGGEGVPDVAALQKELETLRSHHEKLLGETKAAKAKAKEEAEAARVAAEEAARKSGDVSALDKSWSEKYGKAEQEWSAKLEAANKHLQSIMVDNVATKAAADIAIDGVSAELLAKEFRSSLGLAEVDGKLQTVVMDADGKRSALTVEELKKQLESKYPRLCKGSPAGGAGGQPSPAGGAVGKSGDDMVSRAKQIISQHR